VGYGTGTAHAYSAAGTSGQILQSNGTSAPSFVNASSFAVTSLVAGTNISISGSTGAVTVNTINNPSFSTSVTTPIVNGSSTLSLQTGGTTGLYIDGSQNVGIGITSPSAKLSVVGSSYFQYPGGSGLYGTNTTLYSGGGDISIAIGTNSGGYVYQTVTTNHALTFGTNNTERMRIDSSGNVGIGTSSPGFTLDVRATTGSISATSNTGTNYAKLQCNNTGGSYQFGIDNSTGTNFGSGAAYARVIWNDSASAPTILYTNSAERMRIDSSGNVLVGRTSASGLPATSGFIQVADNIASGAFSIGGFGSFLGRQSSDGSTVLNTGQAGIIFSSGTYGSTTERMRVDSSGNLLVGTTNSSGNTGEGTKILDTGRSIVTVASYTTSANSNLIMYSTGAAAYRFYVNWAGNINATSTSITGISDARLKENTVTIKNGLDIVTKLNPITYNFKDLPVCDDGKVQHYGFLAQEVQSVLPTLVAEGLNESEDGSKYLTLKMGDMIPVLVAAIQELSAEVTALKAKVGA